MQDTENEVFTEVTKRERNKWIRGIGGSPLPSCYFERNTWLSLEEVKFMKAIMTRMQAEREVDIAKMQAHEEQISGNAVTITDSGYFKFHVTEHQKPIISGPIFIFFNINFCTY